MFATSNRNSAYCVHAPYEDGLYLVGRRYDSAGSESVAGPTSGQKLKLCLDLTCKSTIWVTYEAVQLVEHF